MANFESALRLNQSVAWIYLERGNLYMRQEQFPQAVADYSEAIRLEPGDAKALRARSLAYHAAHRPEEEIADLTQMLRLDPRDEFALERRAEAYAGEGDTPRALAAYDDWIRFTQSQKAYGSRWRFLDKQADYRQLVDDLRKAVAAGVVERSVHLRLSWLLATCPDPAVRNGKEAVAEATKACEAKEEKDPHSLEVLAAALAEAGDFPQAASTEREALERQKGDSDLRKQMQDRLELYLKGLPYRAPPPQRPRGGDERAKE